MARPDRGDRLVRAMLLITVALWVLAGLFQSRVVNIFDRFLVKRFPGPVVVFGSMLLCPTAAAWITWHRLRAGKKSAGARAAFVLSGLLVVAFVAIIGVPMFVASLRRPTPPNPSVARPYVPPAGMPVFPGAEGFGTDTPAGRGGRLIEVTSLADAGPGTLRAALATPGPRIIVFRVAGTIVLKSLLSIDEPYVTVAGQSAPGGGVCLKDFGIVITTNDVLIQHIRVRPGNEAAQDADDNDAIQILGQHGEVSGAHHVVIDHVSASWSEDEVVSTWYGAHDVTISWSIVSEALNRSRHRKGTHSAGLLVGDSSYNVSLHHNLLAHNGFRNPLISGGGTHDVVNNVIYDWGVLQAEVLDELSNSFINFVGNSFVRGPSTTTAPGEILINPAQGTPSLFVEGNVGAPNSAAAGGEWSVVTYGWDGRVAPEKYRSAVRFAVPPVVVQPAEVAFEKVLATAGASLPERDEIDQRVVADVRNLGGRIIDSPAEVGGYSDLAAENPPADSDYDGMPDDWESAHGLEPSDPTDGNLDRDGDGYTNVEEYLFSLLKKVL